MILRNAIEVRLLPLVGRHRFETRFTLDCGHTERRLGDQRTRCRVLCSTCTANLNRQTQLAQGER